MDLCILLAYRRLNCLGYMISALICNEPIQLFYAGWQEFWWLSKTLDHMLLISFIQVIIEAFRNCCLFLNECG